MVALRDVVVGRVLCARQTSKRPSLLALSRLSTTSPVPNDNFLIWCINQKILYETWKSLINPPEKKLPKVIYNCEFRFYCIFFPFCAAFSREEREGAPPSFLFLLSLNTYG